MPCLDSEECVCGGGGGGGPALSLVAQRVLRSPAPRLNPEPPVSVSDLQQPPSGSGEKGLSSFTGGLGCGWCP